MPNDQSTLDQLVKQLSILFNISKDTEQQAKIMDHLRREITMLTELMRNEGKKEKE